MTNRLFVPLNTKWYELFKLGKKTVEIRGESNRFNWNTVKVGRKVELRRGYAKKGALWGTITNIWIDRHIYDLPKEVLKKALPIPQSDKKVWKEIDEYNTKYGKFIAFEVKLDEAPDP